MEQAGHQGRRSGGELQQARLGRPHNVKADTIALHSERAHTFSTHSSASACLMAASVGWGASCLPLASLLPPSAPPALTLPPALLLAFPPLPALPPDPASAAKAARLAASTAAGSACFAKSSRRGRHLPRFSFQSTWGLSKQGRDC